MQDIAGKNSHFPLSLHRSEPSEELSLPSPSVSATTLFGKQKKKTKGRNSQTLFVFSLGCTFFLNKKNRKNSPFSLSALVTTKKRRRKTLVVSHGQQQ
jgi:hypothetical protein